MNIYVSPERIGSLTVVDCSDLKLSVLGDTIQTFCPKGQIESSLITFEALEAFEGVLYGKFVDFESLRCSGSSFNYSGQGHGVKARLFGLEGSALTIKGYGGTETEATGEFTSVNCQAFGKSRIYTNGPINSDWRTYAQDRKSKIYHDGDAGRKIEHLGLGKVRHR